MRTPPKEVMPLRIGGPKPKFTQKTYLGRAPSGLLDCCQDSQPLLSHIAPIVAALLWGQTPIPEAWSVTSLLKLPPSPTLHGWFPMLCTAHRTSHELYLPATQSKRLLCF